MFDIIYNGIATLWHTMQMIFLYGIAGLLIIFVCYFFYRLEQESAKDKANK